MRKYYQIIDKYALGSATMLAVWDVDAQVRSLTKLKEAADFQIGDVVYYEGEDPHERLFVESSRDILSSLREILPLPARIEPEIGSLPGKRQKEIPLADVFVRANYH